MAADRKRDRSKRVDSTASNTKKQLIVVGLLVLGLILALVTQPKQEDEAGQVEAGQVEAIVTLTQLKPEALAVTVNAEPHPSVLQVQSLASIELETWIDQNPFSASHAETMNKSFSDANGSLRIQAVYGKGDDAVALIGSNLVRVGELLPDGRRVLRISAEGIELSR